MSRIDYEQLGEFYLGKTVDEHKELDQTLLYSSKDLTTHAVCVGMTGSGKTGLCVTLLEEAALDGVPAIIIDPKGDLGNLLLTFPSLSAKEFSSWVSAEEAKRKGLNVAEFAEKQAALWKSGLAKWDQTGERIQRLRSSADFTIFTPGSSAGVSLSILGSLRAPPKQLQEDADLFSQRVSSLVTSILSLLEVSADPIQSKEHVLLSHIFSHAWKQGEDVTFASLIEHIQQPSMSRIGMMPLETFYPEDKRFALAMKLNTALAAPSFQQWLTGSPLDVGSLLYTSEGKPRISVISIAHLSEKERMFFVSVLFNETLSWMYTQSGTTSLRALLYFDEIAGYLPPVRNPASKQPLLTLLKQARAFGLGLVLATQNPVDIDYKALSNTGTWFIGRLSTKQDKERLLDGLQSVYAEVDKTTLSKQISSLDKRVFLLRSVHEEETVLFHTRWAMSYLRGPLTRTQIATLMKDKKALQSTHKPALVSSSDKPVLPKSISQKYLHATEGSVYVPHIAISSTVHVDNDKHNVDEVAKQKFLIPFTAQGNPDFATKQLVSSIGLSRPLSGVSFAPVPDDATQKSSYADWEKSFRQHLYQTHSVARYRSKEFKLSSEPNETKQEFIARVGQLAREDRDEEIAKLKRKYEKKRVTIVEKEDQAELSLQKKKQHARQDTISAVMSLGSGLLGAFLGKKKLSTTTINKAAQGMSKLGSRSRRKTEVDAAESKLGSIREEIALLEKTLEQDLQELEQEYLAKKEQIEEEAVRPKKSGIAIDDISLCWVLQ